MSVKSSPFGTVRVTGRDAGRFVKQVCEGKPYNPAAAKSRERARKLAAGSRVAEG